MAETIQYKCPCCGGRLEFDSGLQKMKCPYCDTTFDVETLEGYDDALKQDAKDDMHWDAAQQPWDDVQMGVYTCKSCGGELVCDESTAATACPFCAQISTIVPSCSAVISFMSFIASITQSVSPFLTRRPTSTNGSASSAGAA